MFGLDILVDGAVNLAKRVFGGGSSGSDGSGGRDYSSSDSYHNSKVTTYDPDKVRVAELENERVGLVQEAQLELMEFNAKMEAAMIEARCRGFHAMQQAMMSMLKEVNTLAEERLVLLENGSREQVQQVEALYKDLEKDIQNDDFMLVKLPQLLGLASQFPEGSTSHGIFSDGIRQEMTVHMNFKTEQLKGLRERCKVVVDSVVASKERMQAHIDNVIVKRIEHIEQVMQSNSQLDFKSTSVSQLNNLQTAASSSDTAEIEYQRNY